MYMYMYVTNWYSFLKFPHPQNHLTHTLTLQTSFSLPVLRFERQKLEYLTGENCHRLDLRPRRARLTSGAVCCSLVRFSPFFTIGMVAGRAALSLVYKNGRSFKNTKFPPGSDENQIDL